MKIPEVFILYDSIHHSIFEGQVLAPLVKKLDAGLHDSVHIVSFEETLSPAVLTTHTTFSKVDPRITITLFKRPRFIAEPLLRFQSQQLKKILSTLAGGYQVSARGPLAGIIAKQAVTGGCRSLTIQARGLLAEEHAYTHKATRGILFFAHTVRAKQLAQAEKSAYLPLPHIPFSVEAVSPALKKYLIHTYGIPSTIFTFPQFDTPVPLLTEDRLFYRGLVRTQLAISNDAHVYVYNGSLKAWQCPTETVAAFKKESEKNISAVFLALTQDQALMRHLLQQAGIPESSYRVLHVPQAEVVRYLCAAEYGMLLREPHILNWVSRPTKLLEYQAAGLEIVHNGTIAVLAEKNEATQS